MSVYIDVYIQSSPGDHGKSYRIVPSTQESYPIVLTKDTIRQRIVPIANTLCRGSVNPSYVSSAITSSTIILTLYKAGAIRAFLLSTVTDDGGLYLDVICAAEHGIDLLKYFLHLAEMNGAMYVTLNSLPSVLSYYPRHGFEHRKSCNLSKPADITIPHEVIEWIRITKPDTQQLMNYPPFRLFLDYLRKMGYTVNDQEICHDPTASLNEYLEAECEGSGYTMRKCFQHSPSKRIAVTRSMTRKTTKKQAKRTAYKQAKKTLKKTAKNKSPK